MGFVHKGLATLAAIAMLVAAPSAASSALSNQDRATKATGYIAAQQKANGSIPAFSPIGSTADAVVSFVAAHDGHLQIKKGIAYLKNQTLLGNVTGIGLEAKVAMAAIAAGRDPHSFGGTNFIFDIVNSEQLDGRYGASTAVLDDALAMLALEAAGVPPSADAQQWLLSAQCTDGGWQYDSPPQLGEDSHCFTGDSNSDFFESDTNTTSYVVQALDAANASAPVNDPFAFFSAIRDSAGGGWGYTWGFQTTDANSTALVLQAYAAAGLAPPSGSMTALRSLQNIKCGGFSLKAGAKQNVGATIGAVMGLLQQPLPVDPQTVAGPAPAYPCP